MDYGEPLRTGFVHADNLGGWIYGRKPMADHASDLLYFWRTGANFAAIDFSNFGQTNRFTNMTTTHCSIGFWTDKCFHQSSFQISFYSRIHSVDHSWRLKPLKLWDLHMYLQFGENTTVRTALQEETKSDPSHSVGDYASQRHFTLYLGYLVHVCGELLLIYVDKSQDELFAEEKYTLVTRTALSRPILAKFPASVLSDLSSAQL